MWLHGYSHCIATLLASFNDCMNLYGRSLLSRNIRTQASQSAADESTLLHSYLHMEAHRSLQKRLGVSEYVRA